MHTILLVEDNDMLQEILAERLVLRGYEVPVAGDGQKGLDLAKQLLPDLILMDMSLPVLDGWEATRQIKQDEETKHIPIIALTAHALAGDREKSIEAGCDDYETKPVNFNRLITKIQKLLNKPVEGA